MALGLWVWPPVAGQKGIVQRTGASLLLGIEIDKNNRVPAYLQIADAIKGLLRSRRLGAGEPFPPERVLAERYGVSRMTMRQANDVLERQGFIKRQRGRGTFAAEAPISKHQQEMRSFTEDMIERGGSPSSKVLSFNVTKPTADEVEFFGLPEQEQVYRIERVRLNNDVPVAFEDVRIPCHLAPGLARFNLGEHSLYAILQENYGIRMAYCIEEISAARPNASRRKLLQMPAAAAILTLQRKTYTVNDTPVEMAKTVYRGDLYRVIVRSVRARKVP
jgi:GntR family transcriptional regulator